MTAVAETKIHPTAVIHPSAKIAENVEIGPYAIIGENVVIGAGSKIGPHCRVEWTKMGKDNVLTGQSSLGAAPQDFKYKGEETWLELGDGNLIREFVTLNRATAASGVTRIGDGCHFLTGSHVGHDAIVGNGVTVINFVSIAGHCEIGDYAVLGGYVGLHQHVKIGAYAMLGAASMAGLDVIPFGTCQGDRAKLRGINLLGMRRAGFGREDVAAVKEAYKDLFHRGGSLEDAAAKLKAESTSKAVRLIVDFIEKSERGVMRALPLGSPDADEKVTV